MPATQTPSREEKLPEIWTGYAPREEESSKWMEKMGWRKGCRQEVALHSGTFFEGTFRWLSVYAVPFICCRKSIGIEKIMRMVYLWSVKTPLGKMKEEIEVRL